MTLSEELAWRGFANQTTYADASAIDGDPITFYWGVDPSASSMQIGNLAAAMMARHFIDHGHKAILLVGGATGMIGDPDGKKQERDLLTLEEIARNKAAIAGQYRTVFAGQEFEIVDNYDWFKDMGYLQFLRDVGKHVPMRQMLGREFVSQRLGEDGAGISYAEFSYSLIQGYDFLHLFREKGATLQLAGADQWGNSIAGVELIRRIAGGEAHVWTAPLIVNKTTGVKFGKSEDGAVWLDANKTSVYKFYQFWLNLDDEMAVDLLKIYTMLPRQEIEDIERRFNEDRAGRLAQKTLAYEVTKLVHGQDKADSIQKISQDIFNNDYKSWGSQEFETVYAEIPSCELPSGASIIDALAATGLTASKSEARRVLEQGGVTIYGGGDRGFWNAAESPELHEGDFMAGYLIFEKGKKNKGIVKLV